jgi:hypothetical protein
LARHEPDIQAAGDKPLTFSELLDLIGGPDGKTGENRHDDIACYLSASEGWAEAVRRLGGAFAAEETKLRDRKAD